MSYAILISPSAIRDLQTAIDYYNEKAENLGDRFADIVASHFNQIATTPTAASTRYKNIRCKPMKVFPYLIMYTIDDSGETVNILRIFNTYTEPIW
jgi:plasmid stabilization system protein ParE